MSFAGVACLGYRLPTEAEWEYAARAGTSGLAYDPNVDAIGWLGIPAAEQTHVVAQKPANAWRLRDVIGNVWEWVWDWYAPYAGPAIDPTGPDVPPAMPGRVIRGMSWFGVLFPLARSASRQQVPADTRNNDLGLRPVRTIL